MKILVIGVGNPILGDDSLGLYVVRELKEKISTKRIKAKIDVEETSLDWITVVEKMIGYDKVILIDTLIVNDRRLFGKIFKLTLKDLYENHEKSYMIHGLSLQTAFEIVRTLSPEGIPNEVIIILVGIRKPLEYSEKLTPMIKRIIPKIIKTIFHEISMSINS